MKPKEVHAINREFGSNRAGIRLGVVGEVYGEFSGMGGRKVL